MSLKPVARFAFSSSLSLEDCISGGQGPPVASGHSIIESHPKCTSPEVCLFFLTALSELKRHLSQTHPLPVLLKSRSPNLYDITPSTEFQGFCHPGSHAGWSHSPEALRRNSSLSLATVDLPQLVVECVGWFLSPLDPNLFIRVLTLIRSFPPQTGDKITAAMYHGGSHQLLPNEVLFQCSVRL